MDRWYAIDGVYKYLYKQPINFLNDLPIQENDHEGWEAYITNDYWEQAGFFGGKILDHGINNTDVGIWIVGTRILEEYYVNQWKKIYHPSLIKRLALSHYQFLKRLTDKPIDIPLPENNGYFLTKTSKSPYDGILLNFTNKGWKKVSLKRSIELYEYWLDMKGAEDDKARPLAKEHLKDLKTMKF